MGVIRDDTTQGAKIGMAAGGGLGALASVLASHPEAAGGKSALLRFLMRYGGNGVIRGVGNGVFDGALAGGGLGALVGAGRSMLGQEG